ncbi:MAG: hypothetical protein KDE27_21100, partial [Planctomycetes bacterium]|nr:hypothetical protein [Planctomycetota bacterium]
GPAVAAPGPAARPAATDAPPLALATGPVTLRDATVHILDTDRGRSHSYGFDVELGAVRGAGRAAWAEPVPFALELRLEQQLRALSLRGSFARGAEDRVTLTAELAGRGIRGASLAPLLPAGARSPLSDGSVTANLEFAATAFARDFDATLRDLRLADGDQELAAIDLLQLRAPELGAERVHVSSLRAEGIRARVTATPDGLQVPGLLLGIAAPPPAGGAAGEATEAPAPAIAEAAARAAPAPASASLPQLQLDELVIAADDLTFRDRRGGDGEPIHTTLRLELATPWQTAAELQETPPLQFRLRGAATPLLANLEVDLTLQALANAPTLAVELTAAGIDTTALPRALPGLADTLAGTETAASLRASLHAELELARSDPTRFDALARPFGGTFTLEGLELLGTDGGELARVPAIDGELRAFDPASGDLLLRSLELDSPTLRAAQTPAGLEVAGLLLKAPPTPDAATAPSESPPAEPLPAEPPPTGAGTTGPEIAVDDLRVYGLAFDWRDATTTPPTLVPIEDLDLRVQRWSTRVLTEPRQFAFDLSVRGGQIPLPRRQDSSSVFAGIARATADLATGGSDEHEIEARPLLEELTLRGHLQVFPIAKGRIDLSVHAFELQALRGMAAPSGVEINDGVLDADIGLDLMAQGIALKSQETFTWLQISEPPSGPISTYLKLPAPLDLVLFALRNDNGEQRIPLQVWLPAREGAPTTRIAQAAIEALSLLISESVGSTPWRMVRTVTDALGISGREELDTEPAVLICAPGSATPDFAPLAALLERVGTGDELGFVLTHELGAADYARAEQLANPDRELAAETVARLA